MMLINKITVLARKASVL